MYLFFENAEMQEMQNVWTYKGTNPYCANCSRCKSTVFIKGADPKPPDIPHLNWKEWLHSVPGSSTNIISTNDLKASPQGQGQPSYEDTILNKVGQESTKVDVNHWADFWHYA